VAKLKVYQREIFKLYTNWNTKFKFDSFASYKALLASTHDSIIMRYMPYLNSNVEHLAFNVN